MHLTFMTKASNSSIPEIFKNLRIIDPNEKIVYCKKCVMSNQRPQVHFNNEEVCGPCLYSEYKHKMVDWDKREKELEELCNKYRKEDGSWDVIVPVSGGKDSSYTAYILKKKIWYASINSNMGTCNSY